MNESTKQIFKEAFLEGTNQYAEIEYLKNEINWCANYEDLMGQIIFETRLQASEDKLNHMEIMFQRLLKVINIKANVNILPLKCDEHYFNELIRLASEFNSDDLAPGYYTTECFEFRIKSGYMIITEVH